MRMLTLKNQVVIGTQTIVNDKDTRTSFASGDLPSVQRLLEQQRSFWPSNKRITDVIVPKEADPFRTVTLKRQVTARLEALNQQLRAPVDAEVRLVDGNELVTRSVNGTQYDIPKLLKAYDAHAYDSVIRLDVSLEQPVRENSTLIRKEKALLHQFLQRSVSYVLQGKPYSFAAAELVKNAVLSKTMAITVEDAGVTAKMNELNNTLSTLHKNYTFRNNAGQVIAVQGQSYGWAIDVPAETKRVVDALIKGEPTVKAYNIYGIGYSTYGVGYRNPDNNGIGTTYAEVSISQQRVWLYKNGQMVLTTNVVTGKHSTGEDTPTGVWYVEYKQSPSVLKGSEVGKADYQVNVNYWAPFTLSGCGFHDAPWRSNWAPDAYLTQGSGGCINTPPAVMPQVYNLLVQNEPVVIY
ncbi:MAG: L,D-transpeptidase family protein [Sporolactobacillus sp.]